MIIEISISQEKYSRLVKEAQENNTTARKLIEEEVDHEYYRLTEKDRKGTCHSGWYQGHKPIEPNDGVRAICSGCGKGLVQYGYMSNKWSLDRTKKALHLKVNRQTIDNVIERNES